VSIPDERKLRRLADLYHPAGVGRGGPYKPAGLRTLGKLVSGIMVVGIGLGVVAVITLALAIRANADFEALRSSAAAVASDNADARYQEWSAWLFLWIRATGVVFVVWLYRIYRQAGAVTAYPFRWPSGWTVGCWFVPFLNLYLPYRLTADVARSVALAMRAIVGTWWGLFLVGGPLTLAAFAILEDPEPSFGAFYTLSAFGTLTTLGSGIAGVVLVRRLTGAVADASERAARPLAPPQPQNRAAGYPEPHT
jgi:hypothetical protein